MRPVAVIVDDEPYTRQWLARLLHRIGIDSYEAENNSQAMALVQAHSPQLITTDMYRPGGTGLEFIHQVRALPKLQTVPIILISGGASLADHEHAKQADVIAILGKPFTQEELYAAIQEIRPSE